jgi:hypothetical protein
MRCASSLLHCTASESTDPADEEYRLAAPDSDSVRSHASQLSCRMALGNYWMWSDVQVSLKCCAVKRSFVCSGCDLYA